MSLIDTYSQKQIQRLVVGVLVALFFYQAMDYIIFSRLKVSLIIWYCNDLLICIEAILLYFYSIKIEGNSFLLLSESSRKIWFYPLTIFTLFAIVAMIIGLSRISERLKWPEIWHIRHSHNFIKVTIQWYQQKVILCILSAISWSVATELIFRGYLLPRFSILMKSNVAAVIVNSIFYALYPFIKTTLRLLIQDFITGVVFSAFYIKYRNIKVLIITRVLVDVILMLFWREFILRFGQALLKFY